MGDLRLPVWLLVAGVYATYSGFAWGRWQNLAQWARLHASVDVATGLVMLLAGIAWLAMRTPIRAIAIIGAWAPAVCGLSLAAGTLLGTIPCTGHG